MIEYIELYSPVLNDPAFNKEDFRYNPDTQTDIFKKYLTEEEVQRLMELNTKFLNWQLLEAMSTEGVSIADLIQQQASLMKEVVNKEDTDLTDKDIETIQDQDIEKERRFENCIYGHAGVRPPEPEQTARCRP